jgi:peptidoglycan hydrolase-like protein with peptidoglycan-binding domain
MARLTSMTPYNRGEFVPVYGYGYSGGYGAITLGLKNPTYNNASVIELQTKLKALGFYPHAIDDDFGDNTEAALKLFQASKSLPLTGIVDAATLAALTVTATRAGAGGKTAGTSTWDKVAGAVGQILGGVAAGIGDQPPAAVGGVTIEAPKKDNTLLYVAGTVAVLGTVIFVATRPRR